MLAKIEQLLQEVENLTASNATSWSSAHKIPK